MIERTEQIIAKTNTANASARRSHANEPCENYESIGITISNLPKWDDQNLAL